MFPKMHWIYYLWLAMVAYAIVYILWEFFKPPNDDD